ncbi:ATP-binding protein [Cupriavidus basilensis]
MAARDAASPQATARLEIRLLGDLCVTRNGEPLPLPASKRTRALLGYLVCAGAAQSRQSLCDLLWDGPDDPRAALRWSLTKLRPLLDDTAAGAIRLVADRERVAFAAQGASVDIARIHALLGAGTDAASLGALEEAARLLHGEFLAGLDLARCYRFYHWCTAERERYDGLRRAVLCALVTRLEATPALALPYGRAMVAADPLAESAHATLVSLLAAAGRYPDAEQHYAYARDMLRRELSTPPNGPLDAAIHRARREMQAAGAAAWEDSNAQEAQGNGLPAAGANGAEQPALLSRPLIGRLSERDAIERLVAGGGSESGVLLLLLGEPGIGKTTLLDHFAGRAEASGFQVLRGRCYEAEMVRPYGLWLDTLRGIAQDAVPPGEARQAAPLLAGGALAGEYREGSREQLFGAVASLLRGLAAGQPLALALDDLQWLDEGSAALLHFLCRTLETGTRMIFAGGARAGEVDDNPWAKGSLHSLAREGRLLRLPLAPLAVPEVAALLGPALAAMDPLAVARDSGGNPLFVLALANARDRARGGNGSHRTLDALIAERLDALEPASRELLLRASAMGRELQPRLLAEVSGIPLVQLLTTLEQLERRGLLKPTGEGHFDFSHDVVRQAAYRAISPPRRRIMHRLIAQQLVAACAEDPRLYGELVHHASLADDALMTAQACLAAGEHCLRVYANDEAALVAGRGLAQLERLPQGTERVRLAIGLLKLRAVAATGAGARRLPTLIGEMESEIRAAEALSLHEEAATGLHILSWLRQQGNDTEGARRAILEAERMTRKADAATRCQQLANTARCLLEVETDLPRARAMIAEADTLAESLDLQTIELMWGHGLLARVDGDLASGHGQVARAVALARQRQDHWREYECLVWQATIAFELGRFDEVLGHSAEIEQAARRMRETGKAGQTTETVQAVDAMEAVEPAAPFAGALGALARLRLGQPAAQDELAASLASLRSVDDKAHLAYALNAAAAMALDRGQCEVAGTCASEALDAARAVRRLTEMTVAAACLVQAAASAGDAARAAGWLAELRWLVAGHQPSARAAAALERAVLACRAIPTLAPTPGR